MIWVETKRKNSLMDKNWRLLTPKSRVVYKVNVILQTYIIKRSFIETQNNNGDDIEIIKSFSILSLISLAAPQMYEK